jgi:HEAT repeat protein
MPKKLILFIPALSLGFFLSLAVLMAGCSSQPENDDFQMDNPMRDDLIEIFDSLNVEDKDSREGLAPKLDELSCKHQGDGEDNEELRSIIELIKTLLTDKSLFQRARAADILGNLHNDFAVRPLIVSLLHDPHFYVRESSAQALGKLRNERATRHLIKAICRDSSREVINHSVNSLGYIRDTRALDTLIYVLTGNKPVKGKNPFFPFKGKKCNTTEDFNLIALSNAAIALGRIKDPEATPALVQALNHRIYLIRISAAQALSLIRDPESLEPLQERLEVETSESVKASIKNAIYLIENL